jgi:hypothetical protein
VEHAPIDRDTTLAIARRARRLLIKTGTEIVRVDADRSALDGAAAERYLVHEDGFMRVPVLLVDDLLVRGYTDALYAEVFATPTRSS